MTREEARKAAEVMLAYANGEEIETLCFEDYIPCENPSFNWVDGKGIENYRIKPKPKYRPFETKEECWEEMLKHQPFGWVKEISSEMLYLINGISNMSIVIMEDINSFKEAMNIYGFKDGTPFGIKEE